MGEEIGEEKRGEKIFVDNFEGNPVESFLVPEEDTDWKEWWSLGKDV
jgi:hypothetical protein